MNVLMILGHPRKASFCAALFNAFHEGATRAGAKVETLLLADLAFEPNVLTESPEHQYCEPDIKRARELIDWADHLVFVYPTWWGTTPALLKGFFDRIVTPGFAFQFKGPDALGWDGLWKGKTCQTLTTMDTPPIAHRWWYRMPGTNAIQRATLGFCGVHTARRALMFGPMRLSSTRQRQAWLERAHREGFTLRDARRRSSRARVTPWVAALRLQFYPMSWAAYTLGALALGGRAVFGSAIYWWGYLCLFALEAATVFANDWFDFASDRANRAAGPFTGGSRVLVDHKLRFRDLRAGIAVALAAAIVCAAFAIQLAPRPIVTTAAFAIAFVLTLGYTVPPLKLCHRGLGELDVAFTHSFMMIVLAWLLQGGALSSTTPWLLAAPLGVAILPGIILSQLPDRRADARAGKQTLPVRLGGRATTWLVAALVIASAAMAMIWSTLPATRGVYRGITWGAVPHAALIVLLLSRLLTHRHIANRRMDGVMAIALAYILWFVAIPFWRLV